MIDRGTPPDLILDLTQGGEVSEMVKFMASSLGLPTVSSSQGGDKEIIRWSSLSEEQLNYLVQVRSPSDIFPYSIRDLAEATMMETAVVFYDDSFSKIVVSAVLLVEIFLALDKHFKNLFADLRIRHKYVKLDKNPVEVILDNLITNEGILNFFIFAR